VMLDDTEATGKRGRKGLIMRRCSVDSVLDLSYQMSDDRQMTKQARQGATVL
jgi:hypothetical protein